MRIPSIFVCCLFFVVTQSKRVTIYFIRHAQSIWNEGKIKNAKRKWGIVRDAVNGLKERFRDAPLAKAGIKQSQALGKWIQGNDSDDAKVLRLSPVVFVASNLLRTRQTMKYAFFDRFTNGSLRGIPETVYYANFLQELECGIDARISKKSLEAISDYQIDGFEDVIIFPEFARRRKDDPKRLVDQECPTPLSSPDSIGPFRQFSEWILGPEFVDGTKFVIVGHSSWLLKFMKAQLGTTYKDDDLSKDEIELRKRKIDNAGLIKFDFEGGEGSADGHVVPKSTVKLYGEYKADEKNEVESGSAAESSSSTDVEK
jgi:phosphohistidine phosphatase SixA